jgi:hypothetical protein
MMMLSSILEHRQTTVLHLPLPVMLPGTYQEDEGNKEMRVKEGREKERDEEKMGVRRREERKGKKGGGEETIALRRWSNLGQVRKHAPRMPREIFCIIGYPRSKKRNPKF